MIFVFMFKIKSILQYEFSGQEVTEVGMIQGLPLHR